MTTPTTIKHVLQKNSNDCMLACVAMAAGKQYEELWSEEDVEKVVDRGGSDNDFSKYLLEKAGFQPYVNGERGKIAWKVHIWPQDSTNQLLRWMLRGRRAILSVPSLNHQGGWHVVYWDGHQVFDPQYSVPGKQYYQWLEQLAPREAWIFDEAPV